MKHLLLARLPSPTWYACLFAWPALALLCSGGIPRPSRAGRIRAQGRRRNGRGAGLRTNNATDKIESVRPSVRPSIKISPSLSLSLSPPPPRLLSLSAKFTSHFERDRRKSPNFLLLFQLELRQRRMKEAGVKNKERGRR